MVSLCLAINESNLASCDSSSASNSTTATLALLADDSSLALSVSWFLERDAITTQVLLASNSLVLNSLYYGHR